MDPKHITPALAPLLVIALAPAGRPAGAADIIAHSAADVVAPDTVFALVATAEHVLAATDQGLLWVDTAGLTHRQAFADDPDIPLTAPGASQRRQADEALLDRYGIPEGQRDTTASEAWLDEMRSVRDRPFETPQGDRPPPEAPSPVRVAAGVHLAFASRGARVYALPVPGQATFIARLPATVTALAARADGRFLAAAAANRIFGIETEGGNASVCVTLPQAPDELAVLPPGAASAASPRSCPQGTFLWRVGQTAAWQGPRGPVPLPWQVRSLVGCGAFALVDTHEGLFLLSSRNEAAPESDDLLRFVQVGRGAPYERLWCGAATPDALVSFDGRGAGAAVSANGGTSWVPVPVARGTPVLAAAQGPEGVWLGSSLGLWRLGGDDSRAARVATETVSAQPLVSPPAWQRWLPTVWVAAEARHGQLLGGTERQDLAATLGAEFPLSPRTVPPRPWVRRSRLALDARADAWTGGPRGGANGRGGRRETLSPPACLAELRRAAIALAMVEPERLQSLMRRARRAAWLPELRLRAEKRLGRNQSLDLEPDTILAPLGLDTVDDLRVEVRATWDLARAVYSPDELAATMAATRVADARRELEALVNRLFFERRRHAAAAREAAALAGAGASSAESSEDGARALEIGAELDALTGGHAGACR